MTFIHNAWYVAALPHEVTTNLLARTILDHPLVLYRQENGEAAALLDICPHRFAPLSMGMLKDGHVQCPYHGLEFDGTGRCVLNPHGNGARPSSLNVRGFPLVERHDLVWVWPGDPSRADPNEIPDFSCRVEANRKTIGGHAKAGCNYRLLVDNLMDLGHAQYVHRANAQSDAYSRTKREVKLEDGAIHALMMFPDGAPTVLASKLLGPSNQNIDQWTDIRWNRVSAMLNFIAFAPTGTPREQSLNSKGTHIITPETESSCHYFFGSSRNFGVDDPSIDDVFRAWQKQALTMEDKPMVEAIEALTPTVHKLKMTPAMLACDEAAVRVSREIDRMLTAESA